MIRLISQEETWRRHGGEQMKEPKACERIHVFEVGGNVVDYSKKSWVYCVELPFTARDKCMN